MNEKAIYKIALSVLAVGYSCCIGLISHSLIFSEKYQGINFLGMLDVMYYVSMVWFVCGFLSFIGFIYLIKNRSTYKSTYALALVSAFPLVVFDVSVLE